MIYNKKLAEFISLEGKRSINLAFNKNKTYFENVIYSQITTINSKYFGIGILKKNK